MLQTVPQSFSGFLEFPGNKLRFFILVALILPLAYGPLTAAQAQGQAPVVDTIIVLDTTASMRGIGGSKNIWDQVRATVLALVEALPDGTRIAIVPFDQGPRLNRAFPPLPAGSTELHPKALDAQVRAELHSYFDSLPADGQRTWIYEAVEYALNRLRDWQAADPDTPHRPSLFLYTDGLDNGPHADTDMSNIAGLYQDARVSLPFLYGFYGDVGEQLSQAARTRLTEAGIEVTTGLPARTVNVQPASLDFGELMPGREVTRTLRFDSRTPTVYGSLVHARLDTTAPVSLTLTTFPLHETIVIGLKPLGVPQPGPHQARLLLSTEDNSLSLNPPLVEVLFQWPVPTATPTAPPQVTEPPPPPTTTPTPNPPTPTAAPTVEATSPARVVAVGSNERLPLVLASYDLTSAHLPPVDMLVITRALKLDWRVEQDDPAAALSASIELDHAIPVNLHVPESAYLQTRPDAAPAATLALQPDDHSLIIALTVPRSQLEALGYGNHPVSGRVILQATQTEVRGSVSPRSESGSYEIPFVLEVSRSLPATLWITIGFAVLIVGVIGGVPLYLRLGIKRFAPGLVLSLNGRLLGHMELADWQKQGRPFPHAKLTIGSFRDAVDLGWGEAYTGVAELFADEGGQPWLRHRGRQGVRLYVRGQEVRPGQAVRLGHRDLVRITADSAQIVTEHILAVINRTKLA